MFDARNWHSQRKDILLYTYHGFYFLSFHISYIFLRGSCKWMLKEKTPTVILSLIKTSYSSIQSSLWSLLVFTIQSTVLKAYIEGSTWVGIPAGLVSRNLLIRRELPLNCSTWNNQLLKKHSVSKEIQALHPRENIIRYFKAESACFTNHVTS